MVRPQWRRRSSRTGGARVVAATGAALILRRLDRRVTLLLRDGHFATARGAYKTFFLGRNCIRGRRFRRGSGWRFRSLERFDRAIQFVALCDEEGDDVVSRHRAILSCEQRHVLPPVPPEISMTRGAFPLSGVC